MKGMTLTARILFYGGAALAFGVAGLKFAVPASAGVLEAQLIVGTAPGIPGGTASVSISLANDDVSAGVSADLDVAYPTDQVEFIPPVNQNCQVAARISSTHIVAGTIPQPGLLRLAVTNTLGLEPLGNGQIAICDFHVLPGVATGTAALTVDFAELTGAEGMVPVLGVDGAIVISEATPVPTPTNTPIQNPTNTGTPAGTTSATVTRTVAATSTATSGGTVISTPTATVTGGTTATKTAGTPGTPTSTPTGGGGTPTFTVAQGSPTATPTGGTRTPTRSPTQNNEDDGCNVVPTGQGSSGGMLALLLAPALLVWARRKRF